MCEINKRSTLDFFIWIEKFFEKRRLAKEEKNATIENRKQRSKEDSK